MQTDMPIMLRPKPTKWLGVALCSLAFVLIGIWMVRSGEIMGWMGIVFFGLCLSVSLICMLPKASYLLLTPDGFTMCSLFRSHTIRWEDVTGFGVGKVFTNKMVMFNFVDSYQRSPRLRSFNTELVGFEAAIPDSYGLKHEDLADLLNRYKASSHGTQEPPQLMPESLFIVEVSDTGVSCSRPDQRVERVTWDDLQCVEVVNTDEGPFLPDVFWVLHGSDGGCVIPQGATGEKQLLERLQKLPDFDNEAVIKAMSVTTNKRSLCWRRPTASV